MVHSKLTFHMYIFSIPAFRLNPNARHSWKSWTRTTQREGSWPMQRRPSKKIDRDIPSEICVILCSNQALQTKNRVKSLQKIFWPVIWTLISLWPDTYKYEAHITRKKLRLSELGEVTSSLGKTKYLYELGDIF